MKKNLSLAALLALSLTGFGCAEDTEADGGGESGCEGEKCDDPNSEAQDACVLAARAAVADDDAIAANCDEGESSNSCANRLFNTCRDDAAIEHCAGRRGEAVECSVESRGTSFTAGAIRWQCADVDGVSRGSKFDAGIPSSGEVERGQGRGAGEDRIFEDESDVDFENKPDSRGQEYCEYFALVQLPDEDSPREVGRLLDGGARTTDHDLSDEFTDELEELLDDEDDAVFGQCVFTSWHQDIRTEYEICDKDPAACNRLEAPEDAASWVPKDGYEFELSHDNLAMKISINSNGAAMDLVDQCMADPDSHDKAPVLSDGIEDEFMRGCLRTYELFTTEWRRSDPAVCAVGTRLRECGCGLDVDGDGKPDVNAGDKLDSGRDAGREVISRVLLPEPSEDNFLRGFPLGTWKDPQGLPDGCRFVGITDEDSTVNGGLGEHGQNLVVCDITAEKIQEANFTLGQAFSDMKTFCQATYAQDVVVHVPIQGNHIPEATLVCDPPAGATNCGDLPHVLGAESGEKRAEVCEWDGE